MATRIYVGNIADETTEEKLTTFFETHGTVNSVAIIQDRETNKPKGFGFVEMENVDEAQKAITNLSNKELDGNKLTVNQARPRAEKR